MQKGKKYFLFELTLTAVLIAISLVVRMVGSVMLPLFGSNTVRLTFEGIFTSLPGLLFGPVFGGVAYGVCDVIGLIVNPSGPWIPLITLANVALGVIQAFTFKALKKNPRKKGLFVFKIAYKSNNRRSYNFSCKLIYNFLRLCPRKRPNCFNSCKAN